MAKNVQLESKLTQALNQGIFKCSDTYLTTVKIFNKANFNKYLFIQSFIQVGDNIEAIFIDRHNLGFIQKTYNLNELLEQWQLLKYDPELMKETIATVANHVMSGTLFTYYQPLGNLLVLNAGMDNLIVVPSQDIYPVIAKILGECPAHTYGQGFTFPGGLGYLPLPASLKASLDEHRAKSAMMPPAPEIINVSKSDDPAVKEPYAAFDVEKYESPRGSIPYIPAISLMKYKMVGAEMLEGNLACMVHLDKGSPTTFYIKSDDVKWLYVHGCKDNQMVAKALNNQAGTCDINYDSSEAYRFTDEDKNQVLVINLEYRNAKGVRSYTGCFSSKHMAKYAEQLAKIKTTDLVFTKSE